MKNSSFCNHCCVIVAMIKNLPQLAFCSRAFWILWLPPFCKPESASVFTPIRQRLTGGKWNTRANWIFFFLISFQVDNFGRHSTKILRDPGGSQWNWVPLTHCSIKLLHRLCFVSSLILHNPVFLDSGITCTNCPHASQSLRFRFLGKRWHQWDQKI